MIILNKTNQAPDQMSNTFIYINEISTEMIIKRKALQQRLGGYQSPTLHFGQKLVAPSEVSGQQSGHNLSPPMGELGFKSGG